MSQHDYSLANASGASFRADVNDALSAIVSLNSGATAPSTTYAYMLWADTTSGWLKQRNAANSAWIHVAPLGTRAAVDVASAATIDLDANAASSDKLRITGTTTTTAITLAEGQTRLLRAAAAWPITHGASLICPGSASYTCAAGDLVLAIGEAAGVVRLMIWKADGTAVSGTGLTLGSPVASTSGATVTFTAPFANVKRVSITFSGVSINGTNSIIVQIGPSGGVETTGYLGGAAFIAGSTGAANFTTGFGVVRIAAAASVVHGTCVLTLENATTNNWCASSVVATSDAASLYLGAGAKAITGELAKVTVTVDGANNFDAGEINVAWE